MKRKKRWLRVSILVVVLLVSGELFARYYLGLGDTPVYIESDEYEYIYAPNQDVNRFGNTVRTNEFSMRSEPLKKSDGPRVLLIGDSVINGGPHIDQDELVSSLLEKWFGDRNVRILNVSAGSWGPDNAFAYLQKHGNFDASLIVLVFSSHDYNDNMHFRSVVGSHRNWPDTKPLLAITDGFNNYIWPKVKSLFEENSDEYAYLDGFDDSAVNSGWLNFKKYGEENNIPVVVYIHPETSELQQGRLNQKGEKLILYLDSLGMYYFNGLAYEHSAEEYRDNIHLNHKGHMNLARILQPLIDSSVTSLTP